MKVAAAGKTAVGTVTILGLLNRMLADEGQTVVAVDGDAIARIRCRKTRCTTENPTGTRGTRQ